MYNQSSIPSKRSTKFQSHRNPHSYPGTSYRAARNIAGMVYAANTGTITLEEYLRRTKKGR